MMVASPIAIYATTFGIQAFNNLFTVFSAFGIAWLPFIVLFVDSLRGYVGLGPLQTVQATAYRLLSMVLLSGLFVIPSYPVDNIRYQPRCAPHATSVRWGNTHTRYDHAFHQPDLESNRLPIGWIWVLNIASGITHTALAGLPCPVDITAIHRLLRHTQLPDMLADEVRRFENDCYHLAQLIAHQQKKATTKETKWLGSPAWINTIYPTLFAQSPVAGFAYTHYPSADTEQLARQAEIAVPTDGFPNCAVWWTDAKRGLKNRLLEVAIVKSPQEPFLGSLIQPVEQWLAKQTPHRGDAAGHERAERLIIEHLLYTPDGQSRYGFDFSRYPHKAGWLDKVTHAFVALGQTWHMVTHASLARDELAEEIPMIQALLVCLCLALGPLILLLGNYSLGTTVSYGFLLVSLQFLPFIETLMHSIEIALHTSLHNDTGATGNSALLYNLFTALYQYLPLLYFMVMGLCGVKAGRVLHEAFQNTLSGQGATALKTIYNIGKR